MFKSSLASSASSSGPALVCPSTFVCDSSCQDSNVAYAIDNAGWLLYNEHVAGRPSGSVNVTASCPLSGSIAITGTVSANGGVQTLQLTLSMTDCGVSAASYSLTFGGALQMNGTFTSSTQNDVTFSASSLTIAGQLMVLDEPTIAETCPVSATDTWNYVPSDVGWLNGQICGRTANDSAVDSGYVPTATEPDERCLLEGLSLTENGQSVDFVDVPDDSFAGSAGVEAGAGDAGAEAGAGEAGAGDAGADTGATGSTGADASAFDDASALDDGSALDDDAGASGTESLAITSAPASLSFATGGAQPLDVAFTDPTASRPAFFVTMHPVTSTRLQCFMCCGGCRATHRVFDHANRGVAHYQATTITGTAAPASVPLYIYPVSCQESGVDPVDALIAGGGAGCTPVIGSPAAVGVAFGGAGTGSSGTSGSTSTSSSESTGGGARTLTESCTVTSPSITCCTDGTCSTAPGASTSSSQTSSVPAGTSATAASQVVCSNVTSALTAAGCTGATCAAQDVTANSFTVVLSCTAPATSGCTAATETETCNVVVQ